MYVQRGKGVISTGAAMRGKQDERRYRVGHHGGGVRRRRRVVFVALMLAGSAGCQSAETRRGAAWFDAALVQRAAASSPAEIIAADSSLARLHGHVGDSERQDAQEAEGFFAALRGAVDALPLPEHMKAPATLLIGVAGTIAATKRRRKKMADRADEAESDRSEIVKAVEAAKSADGATVDMAAMGEGISSSASDRIKTIRRGIAADAASGNI